MNCGQVHIVVCHAIQTRILNQMFLGVFVKRDTRQQYKHMDSSIQHANHVQKVHSEGEVIRSDVRHALLARFHLKTKQIACFVLRIHIKRVPFANNAPIFGHLMRVLRVLSIVTLTDASRAISLLKITAVDSARPAPDWSLV